MGCILLPVWGQAAVPASVPRAGPRSSHQLPSGGFSDIPPAHQPRSLETATGLLPCQSWAPQGQRPWVLSDREDQHRNSARFPLSIPGPSGWQGAVRHKGLEQDCLSTSRLLPWLRVASHHYSSSWCLGLLPCTLRNDSGSHSQSASVNSAVITKCTGWVA